MKTRYATLIAFCTMFELISIATSWKNIELSWQLLIALGFGASMIGRAVAYLTVFEWLRAPFTQVVAHSSGAGESVEPKDGNPIISVIGAWMSCPICAGTWGALGLLAIYAYAPSIGRVMIYTIGAAGFASLITRTIEAVEWIGRGAWEYTGHMNRSNKIEQEPYHFEKAIEADYMRVK